jgi:hypothetical protein
VDPIVVAILLVILVPIAVVWALSKSASLRGPAVRPMSRRPVDTLVTEAIPEEHPDEEGEGAGDGPDFALSADQPARDEQRREPR